MLVLARKPSESVTVDIGDGRTVFIQVVDVQSGDKVKLGFTAPDDVIIHRSEVWDRINQKEKP